MRFLGLFIFLMMKLNAGFLVDETPKFLYKILTTQQWEKSKQSPTVLLTDFDYEFVHLAKKEQVEKTIKKFFSSHDVVILEILPEKLIGTLKYERNPGGENYYFHLYNGQIPMSSIHHVEYKKMGR